MSEMTNANRLERNDRAIDYISLAMEKCMGPVAAIDGIRRAQLDQTRRAIQDLEMAIACLRDSEKLALILALAEQAEQVAAGVVLASLLPGACYPLYPR